ncbi:hypothetical protein, partial [Xylella fastidiosa]|uniref:hypothetical protein n=1 Tax=Xylella fastidiosa TaxID=2371 RepID=UPI0019D60B3F
MAAELERREQSWQDGHRLQEMRHKEEIKTLNKQYGCEVRDPCGTICSMPRDCEYYWLQCLKMTKLSLDST